MRRQAAVRPGWRQRPLDDVLDYFGEDILRSPINLPKTPSLNHVALNGHAGGRLETRRTGPVDRFRFTIVTTWVR
jgi:hypothetical protein